jgi:zinc protease
MIEVNRYTLGNGLRMVHSEDNSTQMVALNIIYNVGAKDENENHTGFAHLFEHLMFGGSVNIHDYDTPLQQAGGENNAWTNNDITNFYLTVPAQNKETAFWLESDRMLSLDFSPHSLEVQRQVVMEEFKQRCLNQPYGDVDHILRKMAYKRHPYRWPTIGKDLSHIANATLEEVKDFFFHFYAPNNAILAITGHITFEEAKHCTKKWFDSIPRRKVDSKNIPAEPYQQEEHRAIIERPVPVDAFYMVFHMVGRKHPDYYAFDILSDVLSNGKSSRFARHLVNEKKIFSSINAYISGSIDAGLFQVTGRPTPGVSLKQAEAAVWDELEALKMEKVTDDELGKVKNKFESEHIFNNIHYLNVATNLAYFELIGKAEDLNVEVARYRSVTPDQLQCVALTAFQHKNASILYYKATNKESV